MSASRYFLAVPVTGMAARRLHTHAARHRQQGDRITDRRDLHVTIHFFGARNAFRMRRIIGALDPDVLPAAFTARFSSVGPFAPTRGRHLVALPDAPSARRLGRLYEAAVGRMAHVAPSWFPRHRYLPHVTLARTKPRMPPRRMLATGATFRVGHIALYRSGGRSRGGPRYDILRRWRLRNT